MHMQHSSVQRYFDLHCPQIILLNCFLSVINKIKHYIFEYYTGWTRKRTCFSVLAAYEPNKVLYESPPEVAAADKELLRESSAFLAQLRCGYCKRLNYWRNRAPVSVHHLFNCPEKPMDLTPRDLWDRPREVVQFLDASSIHMVVSVWRGLQQQQQVINAQIGPVFWPPLWIPQQSRLFFLISLHFCCITVFSTEVTNTFCNLPYIVICLWVTTTLLTASQKSAMLIVDFWHW